MSNSILPEGLLRFIDNYDEKHPNECSARYRNTYELKTVDMDGNVIDTQYALNLMSDYGFKGAYKYHERGNWTESTDRRIWIGDSTEYPKYNNNVLYSPITNSEPQGITSNYNFDHCEGMRYNKTDKICSMTRKGSSCYYDYNILDTSGNTITEDKYIREIGVGYDKNTLVMHARVYNEAGELSAIIKRPNQRLYITTYYTTTMDPKIIQDNYDNGIYCAIDMRIITKQTAAEKLTEYYKSGYVSNHTDIRRYISTQMYPFYGRWNGGSDGSMNHYSEEDFSIEYSADNFGGGLIEGQLNYLSEAFGECSYNWKDAYDTQSVYLIDFNIYNEGPEEIQQTVFTNNRYTGLLSYTFGRYYAGYDPDGRIPTLDFDLQEVRAYNHETKAWDIEERFVNNNALNLYDRWIGKHVIVKMYVTFLDRHQDVYVFINRYTDRPITSFDNSGFTLYATDTYWDTDSWEIIANLNNIPTELGSKRYYISLTNPGNWPDKGGTDRTYKYYANGRGLFPIRGNETYHKILPASSNNGYKEYSVPYKSHWSQVSGRTATSDKYGYVFTPTCVIYPDNIDDSTGNPYIHQVLGDGGTPPVPEGIFNFDKEDKVLVIGEPTSYQSISGSSGYFPKPLGGWYWGFRVYDMTNSDHTTAPTYQDYPVQTQLRPVNNSSGCGYNRPLTTKSSNGFVVMSGLMGSAWDPFPYIRVINLYGGDDKNTVETYDLSGNNMGVAIDRSDFFCVYTKDEIPTMQVINVNTREVYRTFTFESGTSIRGFIGWKDYIYIHTMKNNTRFSWVYHIEDSILEYLPNEDYQILETCMNHYWEQAWAMSTSSTDDTFVIGTDIGDNNNGRNLNRCYSVSYFTNDNPTHIERVMLEDDLNKISNTDGAGNVYRASLQVKYINGEKRQLICAYGGRYRFIVHDLGLRVDNPSDVDVKYFPFNSFKSYGEDKGPAIAIYKDRVFDIQLSTSNNNTVIKETPLEYCIRHRVKGTTRTITSYNNPVNVSPIPSSSLKMINRVDSKGIPVSVTDEPASGA